MKLNLPSLKSAALCCLLLVVVAAGCNQALVGTWKTDPVPTGDTFFPTTVTFKEDGSFMGVAHSGDQNVRMAGTYKYDGFKLKLTAPGKPDRTYDATVIMGTKLKVSEGDKKLTMVKQ